MIDKRGVDLLSIAEVLAWIAAVLSKFLFNYSEIVDYFLTIGGAVTGFLLGEWVTYKLSPSKCRTVLFGLVGMVVVIGVMVCLATAFDKILEWESAYSIAMLVLSLALPTALTLAARYDREQEKTEETDSEQFKELCIEDKLGLIEQREKELNKGDQKDGNTYIVTVKKEHGTSAR